MAHIKEPRNVDFVINSRPLTKEEELAISHYILAYKAKHTNNLSGKSARKISTKRAARVVVSKKVVA